MASPSAGAGNDFNVGAASAMVAVSKTTANAKPSAADMGVHGKESSANCIIRCL